MKMLCLSMQHRNNSVRIVAKPKNKTIMFEEDRLRIKPYTPRLRALPVPLVDVCASPTVCVSVNASWASHIIGALELLRQPDTWIGTDEEIYDTLQGIERIQNMFSNPCGGNDLISIIGSNQEVIRRLIIEKYDGSNPESIDPDTPDTNFDSDSEDTGSDIDHRDAALCWACMALVEAVCAYVLEIKEQEGRLANIIIGLVAFVPVIGPFLAIALTQLYAAVEHLSHQAFENDTAKENVACCLYLNLKGQPNTFNNFKNSGQGCYEGESSFENDIMQAMNNGILKLQENWIIFNKGLAEGYRYSKAGIIEPCGCGVWCYEWDFENFGELGWFALETSSNQTLSEFVAGQGWRGVLRTGSSCTNAPNDRIGFQVPENMTIKRVVVTYSTTGSIGAQNVMSFGRDTAIWDAGGETNFGVGNYAIGNNVSREWTGTFNVLENEWIRMDFFQCTGNVQTIHKIRLEGEGDNPFGSDNCV